VLARKIFGVPQRSKRLKLSRIPFDFGNKSFVSGSDRQGGERPRGGGAEEEEIIVSATGHTQEPDITVRQFQSRICMRSKFYGKFARIFTFTLL
jgi:hypothetical protein